MPLLNHELIEPELCDKLYREGFRGVFLGGCIERKEGSNIRRSGHCHLRKDPFFGYICIKSKKPERCVKDGKLTNLFKHELAHLIDMNRGGNGYGKGFCEAGKELGYRLMKYEHKTVRDNWRR
jgi:hypothetical protein